MMNILDPRAEHVATRGSLRAMIGAGLAALLALAACGDDNKTTSDASDTGSGDTTSVDAVDTTEPDTTVTDTADIAEDTADMAEDAADVAEDTDVAGDTSTSDTDVLEPLVEFAIMAKGTPVDITPDGGAAIFWDNTSQQGDTYVYDVSARTFTLETTTGPTFRDFPTAVSANLEITANYGLPVSAGLWTQSKEWRRLGSLFAEGCGIDPDDQTAGDIGAAWDISADGSIVVGLIWDGCTAKAFRWSEVDGARDFRTLEEVGSVREDTTRGPNSRATVISDDGAVAGGWVETSMVDRWPTLWDTTTGAGTRLSSTDFTEDSPGEILAISPDGKAACGVWNQNGFVWTEAGGVVPTGALEGVLPSEPTFANAIVGDGDLVFGASGGGFFGVQQAFVWSPTRGMRRLVDIANAAGAEIPETLTLSNVLGASNDGTVLIGTLLDDAFAERSFVLKLPLSAYTN
ncbi:MAG TPA: hypothetical protein PK095_00235 [Myxococcota bacterium]|nr:hypothetical protein [Myxococcota bacterium]